MRFLVAATLLGATALGGVAYAAQTAAPDGAATVTRAQFIDRAGRTFDRLDADKDGVLTKTERTAGKHARRGRGAMGGPFIAAGQDDGASMTPPPSKSPRATRREGGMGGGMRADTDGDGTVSRTEFAAQSGKMFQRLDTNGDGTIDAAELGATPAGGRMAGRLDGDGDGKVTRAEFDKQTGDRFARMDANGDGVLDAAEMPQRRAGRRGGAAAPSATPAAPSTPDA